MNFDILYSIAVDLIKKRSVQFDNDNGCVCVLMTQSNSIFTGMSGSSIQNGKLVPSCAEHETIKIMLNSNENRIIALVVVNCQSFKPCIPCEECKNLILEINPENIDCSIMNEDKSFIKLSDLFNSTSQPIWETGWDDSISPLDSTPNTNISDIFTPNSRSLEDVQTNPYNTDSLSINSFQDNGNIFSPNSRSIASLQSNSLNSMGFNPMPQTPINNNGMRRVSTYQAIPLSGGNSVYMESINGASTLQTAVVQKSNSTFARQSSDENSDASSRFKERLKGIMASDNVDTSVNVSNDKTQSNSEVQSQSEVEDSKVVVPKQPSREIPTKKELKALAKERKKQAKRNNKLLQSIEKRSKK